MTFRWRVRPRKDDESIDGGLCGKPAAGVCTCCDDPLCATHARAEEAHRADFWRPL